MWGSIGNDIFVMLAGYFLAASSGIKLSRLLNLWLRMFFWSVFIYGVFAASGLEAFSFGVMLKNAMPVTQYLWWFASTYFVMYIVHPYLNKLLHNLSKEEYRNFLILFTVYHILVQTTPMKHFLGSKLSNFLYLYSLAGYIRLRADIPKNAKFIFYGTAIVLVTLVFISVVDACGVKFPHIRPYTKFFPAVMKISALIVSLCWIIGFSSLNIPHNKFINILASATFGVYLIHDNNFVRPFLWHNVFKNASFQDSPYLVPYSIAVILTVYILHSDRVTAL